MKGHRDATTAMTLVGRLDDARPTLALMQIEPYRIRRDLLHSTSPRPWSLSILLVVAGLLIVALAIPLAHRRVPPNRWYGIRLPSTLADEELWYTANARAGRDMIIVGAVVTLLALAAPLARPHWPPELRTLLVAIVLVVGSMIATVRAVRHAGRLRRERGIPS